MWVLKFCLGILITLVPVTWALNQGLGAGGSMRFTGNTVPHTQVIRSKLFPAGTFDKGFSILFYFRSHQPTTQYSSAVSTPGSAGAYFSLWKYAENGRDSPLFVASDYDAGAIQVRGAYRSQCPNNVLHAQPNGISTDWVHYAYSYDRENKQFLAANDVGTDKEAYYNASECEYECSFWESVQETFEYEIDYKTQLNIGAGEFNDYDLNGEIDEVCVVSRGVTLEEIKNVREKGCENGLDNLDNLELLYTFDQFTSPLYDEKTHTEVGTINSVAYDDNNNPIVFVQNKIKHEDFPTQIPSDSPQKAGIVTFRRLSPANSDNVLAPITCTDCSTMSLDILPSEGIMCLETTTLGVVDASCPSGMRRLRTSDDISVNLNNTVDFVYVPTATTTPGDVDQFTVRSTGGNNDADINGRILTNIPPILSNVTVEYDPSISTILYVPHHSSTVLSLSGSTATFKSEIVALEGDTDSVKLYYCSECAEQFIPDYYYYSDDEYELADALEYENQVSNSSLPLMLDLERRIILQHQNEYVTGENLFSIRWRMFDGLEYSNEASIFVTIKDKNFPPQASEILKTMDEDSEPILIDLDASINDLEEDVYTVEIESLPVKGKLFMYHNPEFSGEEIEITSEPESEPVSQWVVESDDNEASQCWDEQYCVGATVGGPKVYPGVGDDQPSWQPEDIYQDMWIIVNFADPIFATSMTIYEVWSPGGAYKIEAEDYDQPGTWDTMWEGEPTLSLYCPNAADQCAGAPEYKFCPKTFRTKKVKIHFTITDGAQWIAVDAVMLNGFKKTYGNFLQTSVNKVWYKPNSHENGEDTFTYSASDCNYFKLYKRLQGPNSRRAETKITIVSKSDAPDLGAWDIPSVLPQNSIPISFDMYDPDGVTSNHILQITEIDSHLGEVSLDGQTITPSQLPYTVPYDSWNKIDSSSYQVELVFKASNCESGVDQTFTLKSQLKDDTDVLVFDIQSYQVFVACSQVETILERNHMPQNAATLGMALSISGMIYAVVLITLIIIRKNATFVRLASGMANLPIIIGAFLVYASLLLMAKTSISIPECADIVDALNGTKFVPGDVIAFCPSADLSICSFKYWMFTVGATLLLSTLLIKTERVNTIFNNKSLRKVKFSQNFLLKKTAMYVFFWVVVLLVMHFVDPQLYSASIAPAYFDVESQKNIMVATEVCAGNMKSVMDIVTIIWLAFLLLRGTYLAFITRNIELKAMNDSKEIGMSLYNIFILGTASFLASLAMTNPGDVFFATAIPIWLILVILLTLLYGIKFAKYGMNGDLNQSSITNNTAAATSAGDMSTTVVPENRFDNMTKDEKITFFESELQRLRG